MSCEGWQSQSDYHMIRNITRSCFYSGQGTKIWVCLAVKTTDRFIYRLKTRSVEFCSRVLQILVSKKGKHIFLVGFNTWLVKWVDRIQVTWKGGDRDGQRRRRRSHVHVWYHRLCGQKRHRQSLFCLQSQRLSLEVTRVHQGLLQCGDDHAPRGLSAWTTVSNMIRVPSWINWPNECKVCWSWQVG